MDFFNICNTIGKCMVGASATLTGFGLSVTGGMAKTITDALGLLGGAILMIGSIGMHNQNLKG